MDICEFAIQTAGALLGAFGFCLIYRMKPRHIVFGSIGGAVCWVIYLSVKQASGSALLSAIAASAFAALYAECSARIVRTAATIIYLPTVIPLVPGGILYYTMDASARGDLDAAIESAKLTLMFAIGIAFGTCFVWGVHEMIRRYGSSRR